MKLTAKTSKLNGRLAIPGSKSHTIRAVAIASLASGESEITAPLASADTLAAVDCYRRLGAQIECSSTWRIRGTAGRPTTPTNIIDVANSGTTLRFAMGTAALLPEGTAVFTGDDQIRSRPQAPLLKSLNDLGAHCHSTRNNGLAPIVITGQLRGGHTQLEAVTSQYLSSLLVNTPLAQHDTTIELTKLNEQPYVSITLAYLDEQMIEYQNDNFQQFTIKGGQSYKPFSMRIPADFSSATFFLCAAAILDGELILEGLDFDDTQGDKAVVDMLQQMGAKIDITENEVIIRTAPLHGAQLDLNATPDALPALAIVACFAEGTTKLHNVPQARLKETDRIAVMATELRKLGATIDELEDGLIIQGSKLHQADVSGHHDHRVVMALSLAGMAMKNGCTVDTAQAVNVTFPEYIALMRSVGADITIED